MLAKGLAKERVHVTIDADRLRVATTSGEGERGRAAATWEPLGGCGLAGVLYSEALRAA